MTQQSNEPDLVAATTELKESLEGMSANLDELSEQMSEVADGYTEFGESIHLRTEQSTTVQSGHTAADD